MLSTRLLPESDRRVKSSRCHLKDSTYERHR